MSMLEVTLKSNETLSKTLHSLSKNGDVSTSELLVYFMTQVMSELTTVQTMLCVTALSIQELTDEVKAWRSDTTDEE